MKGQGNQGPVKKAPMTVKQLTDQLRVLKGRLGRRDRAVVDDAIEGLCELALRLHEAKAQARPVKSAVESLTVEVNPLDPFATTPRTRKVLTDIQEPINPAVAAEDESPF